MPSLRASLCTLSREQLESLRFQIARGDKEACAEFYDATVASLYRSALQIVGRKQEAEEVIFDVYQWFWKYADETTRFDDIFCGLLVVTRRLALAKKRARSPLLKFLRQPINFFAHWVGTSSTRRKIIPKLVIPH